MNAKKIVLIAVAVTLGGIEFFTACTKNSNPLPPVHDTLTVVKTDTVQLPPPKPDTPNLKNGLLVYLPFNGSFADSSGNGNVTTTVNNAALTFDEHGYASRAFGATGHGEAVLVTNNGSIKFDTAYSFSMDLMITSTGVQMFAVLAQYSNDFGPTFGIGTNQPGLGNLINALVDTTVGCNNYNNQLNTTIDTCQFIPQPNNWYNVIGVFSKGVLSTYVNGQLISSKTAHNSVAKICPAAQLIIGSGWGGVASMTGRIDEFRLYNRGLGAKEIAWLSRNFQPITAKYNPGLQTRH